MQEQYGVRRIIIDESSDVQMTLKKLSSSPDQAGGATQPKPKQKQQQHQQFIQQSWSTQYQQQHNDKTQKQPSDGDGFANHKGGKGGKDGKGKGKGKGFVPSDGGAGSTFPQQRSNWSNNWPSDGGSFQQDGSKFKPAPKSQPAPNASQWQNNQWGNNNHQGGSNNNQWGNNNSQWQGAPQGQNGNRQFAGGNNNQQPGQFNNHQPKQRQSQAGDGGWSQLGFKITHYPGRDGADTKYSAWELIRMFVKQNEVPEAAEQKFHQHLRCNNGEHCKKAASGSCVFDHANHKKSVCLKRLSKADAWAKMASLQIWFRG